MIAENSKLLTVAHSGRQFTVIGAPHISTVLGAYDTFLTMTYAPTLQPIDIIPPLHALRSRISPEMIS